jgi:hypothetical protein
MKHVLEGAGLALLMFFGGILLLIALVNWQTTLLWIVIAFGVGFAALCIYGIAQALNVPPLVVQGEDPDTLARRAMRAPQTFTAVEPQPRTRDVPDTPRRYTPPKPWRGERAARGPVARLRQP